MNEALRKYFSVLYEERNISRAADRLFLSRQALSASLKRAEDELGVPLFQRGKEGLVPTRYGQMLNSCIQEMDSVWNSFLQRLEEEKDEPAVFRIGMSSLVFNLLDYQRVCGFEDMEKNVSIEIVDQHLERFLSMFREGELDLFYASLPLEEPGAVSVQLTNEELVLLISSDNPLARQETIDFANDLAGVTLLFSEGSYHDTYGACCEQYGIRYKIIADSRGVLQARLQKNRGACLTLGSIADRFLSSNVVVRRLTNCPLRMDPFLIYRRGLPPKGMRFVRYILGFHYKTVPELPAQGVYYCDHIVPPWE